MEFLIQGFTFGIAYVAPIGVQNIFVINTALVSTWPRVIINSLIITFFDITLALACFYGIGELIGRYEWLKSAVLLGGGIILIVIGIKLLLSRPPTIAERRQAFPPTKIIVTSFIVTWLNPQAIIDGAMILGALRSSLKPDDCVPFIWGVCAASLSWFLGLASAVNLLRRRLGGCVFSLINILCGSIIFGYGCKLIFNFIKGFLEMNSPSPSAESCLLLFT